MKRNQNVNALVAAPNAYTTNAYAASDRTAAHAPIPGGRPVITATNLIMDYAARRKTANRVGTTPMSALANTAPALNNVSFRLNVGETVAIMGPSGSGKSTLLHMLGGLDRPTSGTVMVDGQDIFSLKEEALTIFRRRKIGFVFQAYNLVPVLNVYENIVLPIELDGGKVNKDFVQQIVQTLGLDDRLDALPNQLSGGQQQRVAIARALAAAPAIILADEPTGNLDSKTSQDVLSLLKVTSQKFAQTIVMITHNEEIAQMADRIIRIEDGRIVSQN